VSHDAGEVKALASRVVLLDEGRVKAAGGVELL
jgi:ABC-type molybdate transport system ATPase subunit